MSRTLGVVVAAIAVGASAQWICLTSGRTPVSATGAGVPRAMAGAETRGVLLSWDPTVRHRPPATTPREGADLA